MSDHQLVAMAFFVSALCAYWLFVRDAQRFGLRAWSWILAAIPVFVIVAISYVLARFLVAP